MSARSPSEDGEPLGIRDCTADRGQDLDPLIFPGHLPIAAEEGASTSFALVVLGVVEDSLLVAVPHASWNKAVARRRLPKQAWFPRRPLSSGDSSRWKGGLLVWGPCVV